MVASIPDPLTKNCAIIGGKRISEIAKIIGITPAVLMRSGR